jgi:hypothetical protein
MFQDYVEVLLLIYSFMTLLLLPKLSRSTAAATLV